MVMNNQQIVTYGDYNELMNLASSYLRTSMELEHAKVFNSANTATNIANTLIQLAFAKKMGTGLDFLIETFGRRHNI